MRGRQRLWTAVGVSVLALPIVMVGQAVAADGPDPAVVGQWTRPFEQGGAEQPRCERDAEGIIVCKPAAVTMAALPDGRAFYANGIEGAENVRFSYALELGPRTFNDQTRVMDFSGDEVEWITPTPRDGGSVNPEIEPGADDLNDDPFGSVGAPGRPGDGFTGSTAGQVAPQESTSPPDDASLNDGNIFCADIAQLADGRNILVGGTDYYNEPAILDRSEGDPVDVGVLELEGLRSAKIFDWRTDEFTQAASMEYGRWYPTAVTMADGDVLVATGVRKLIKSSQLGQVRRTETYDVESDKWSTNFEGPQSETTLPLAARLNLMPNGTVFFNAVGQQFGTNGFAIDEALHLLQQSYDPQTKAWTMHGPALGGARGAAFQALLPLRAPYADGTLLTFGGSALAPSPGSALATTLSTLTTVGSNGEISNRLTAGQLNHRRWFSDGVVLPDGTVLAINGGDKDSLVTPGLEIAERRTEVYDPATDRWTELAASGRDRHYHNTSVLLPDGRVLVGGLSPVGAGYGKHADQPGFANNDKDSSFEIFSPPYLFRGERPEITSAPKGVAWGDEFDIGVGGGDVSTVTLMRLMSPQHNHDSDQRSIVLPFTQDGDTVRAQAPPSGNVAPPGFYYLFVNRASDKGEIPSVARVVHVGEEGIDGEAKALPADYSAPASQGDATPAEDSSMVEPGGCSGCPPEQQGSDLMGTTPGNAGSTDGRRPRRRR
ncbi:MAG: galactose oxidase-like domain-containing protein [Pseudonocardia sp.]